MKQKPKVLVIAGTTASGKTDLAIKLAQGYGGEIISADSRQVYRKLDIGTAKVTAEEMNGIPHHLIDVADITEVYTAADFVRDGQAAITDITARGKLPIVAGGTFFYVDLLLGRTNMSPVAPNPELRAELEAMRTDELYAELRERDGVRAATIDPHNKRRLVRALEIIASLGRVPTVPTTPHYDTLWLGIARKRDEIRARIETRAHDWLSNGFKAEVEWLLEQNLAPARLREFGFEYTVGVAWVNGEIDDQQFIEQIVAKNWQYAKQQRTWLKKNEDIVWLTPDADKEVGKLVTNWRKG